MLKGINPLLSPDLLKILAEMGHGDEIVLADANFTAMSLAAGKPVIQMPGVGMGPICAAVLSVFPLDEFVEQPCAFMQVGGAAEGYRSALQREVIDRIVLRVNDRIATLTDYEKRRSEALAQITEGKM